MSLTQHNNNIKLHQAQGSEQTGLELQQVVQDNYEVAVMITRHV